MPSDRQIKTELNKHLNWDTRVSPANITLAVKNGQVQLTGTVNSFASYEAAESIAWEIDGVTEVQNDLEINFTTSFGVPTDNNIKSDLNHRLRTNNQVDPSNLVVQVTNGIVTLAGTVRSLFQKDEAEQEAYRIPGVRQVQNDLSVVYDQDIDDQVLAQRLTDRLVKNVSIDLDNIDITVKDCQVTLSGQIASRSDWRSIYDTVRFTHGVKAINDLIKIRR